MHSGSSRRRYRAVALRPRTRLQNYSKRHLCRSRDDRSRAAMASYGSGRGDLRMAVEALAEEIERTARTKCSCRARSHGPGCFCIFFTTRGLENTPRRRRIAHDQPQSLRWLLLRPVATGGRSESATSRSSCDTPPPAAQGSLLARPDGAGRSDSTNRASRPSWTCSSCPFTRDEAERAPRVQRQPDGHAAEPRHPARQGREGRRSQHA